MRKNSTFHKIIFLLFAKKRKCGILILAKESFLISKNWKGVLFLERRKTGRVMVGKIGVGCEEPISIQSMLNTKNGDFEAAKKQTEALAAAGCDIVRLAVTDEKSIEVVKRLKQTVDIPLVADIQFDYRLAIQSV